MAYGRDDFDPSDREPRDRTPATSSNWWEQPRPPGYPENLPWPPALPPGAHYGPTLGSVIGGDQGAINTTPGAPPSYWHPETGQFGPGAPAGNPAAGGGGAGGIGGGGVGTAATSTTTPFAWPQFTPPGFTPTQPFQGSYSFTPFSYGAFKAPTLEEARNAPGYQFGLQQGQDALLNAAARMGVARGGGTLKDLFNFTNTAAEQNYGNVFNQELTGYTTNRDTAFNQWAANNAAALNAFGAQKDVYNLNNQAARENYLNAFQNASAAFNPQFQASTLSFGDAYNRWLARLNSLTNIATAGAR